MKKGYIIDTPNATIKFGDKVYRNITASTGQLQVQNDKLEINGGQFLDPLFEMATKETITVTMTDAQFNTDMLEAYGAVFEEGKRRKYEMTTDYVVDKSDGTIKIKGKEVKAEDIIVNGITFEDEHGTHVSGSIQKGYAKVEYSSPDTTITFNDDMKGKTISPVYSYQETSEAYKFLEGVFPKQAEVILQFPLYEDENADGTPSTVQITIYKASVKATPTFGGNYKTASTFQMELTALNPRRPDKEKWAIDIFEPEK